MFTRNRRINCLERGSATGRETGDGRERVFVGGGGERREREGRRNNGRGMADINKWKESIKKRRYSEPRREKEEDNYHLLVYS
jgi:hypothetical protein